MGDTFDVYDRAGRRIGTAQRRSSGQCCMILSLVGILVVFGAVGALVVGGIQHLTTSPPPPQAWNVDITSDKAQHSGPFDTNDPNGMMSGASLTFSGISAPQANSYSLTLKGDGSTGWTNSNQSYTLLIIVNGNTVSQFHLVEDTTLPQPFTVPLVNGDNTIKLELTGQDDHYSGSNTHVDVSEILVVQQQ